MVPSNINFTVNSNIDKVHYDKLDLEAVSATMQIKDETIRISNVKATDLRQTANSLAADFKQQATDFAKQKVDRVKSSALSAVKDTLTNARNQVLASVLDSSATGTRKKLEESGKGLIDNLNPFRKKKKATDSVKQ